MAAALDDVMAQAMELTEVERLKLAEKMYDSVEPDNDFLPFDPEWVEIIRQRIAKIEAGEMTFRSWEEVRQSARDAAERRRNA